MPRRGVARASTIDGVEATPLEVERIDPRKEAKVSSVILGTEMEFNSIPVNRERGPVESTHVTKVSLSVTVLLVLDVEEVKLDLELIRLF